MKATTAKPATQNEILDDVTAQLSSCANSLRVVGLLVNAVESNKQVPRFFGTADFTGAVHHLLALVAGDVDRVRVEMLDKLYNRQGA